MLVLVEIASFAVDPVRNSPLIILKESAGERTLAIPIGPMDASVIAIKSLDVKVEKPLAVDLVKLVAEALGGRIERIVIYDHVGQSFLSHFHVLGPKGVSLIDCTASDAVSLALRSDAPVFVAERVFEKIAEGEELSEGQRLRKTISAMDTINFGKYYLE